jgi:hypothetical protein
VVVASIGGLLRSSDRLVLERGDVPENARTLGDGGLYVTNARPGERVGRMVKSRRVWERPVTYVFGFGHSSDYGWSVSYDKAAGLYVGSLGQAADPVLLQRYRAGRPITIDLADDLLVAFRADDGSEAWRRRGATDCFTETDNIVPVCCVPSGRSILQENADPVLRRPRVVARDTTLRREPPAGRWT